MSERMLVIAAAATAAIVVIVGLVFVVARPTKYESTAAVVLSPDTEVPDRISSLLESFQRSGTLGTYVELMASGDTTAQAQAAGVDITVRAVPDTRTIQVTGVGDHDAVQPAVSSVIDRTQSKQSTLRDLFALAILEEPSGPVESGPGTPLILAATLLLAAFAAIAVFLILRRVAPAPPRKPESPRPRQKPDRRRQSTASR